MKNIDGNLFYDNGFYFIKSNNKNIWFYGKSSSFKEEDVCIDINEYDNGTYVFGGIKVSVVGVNNFFDKKKIVYFNVENKKYIIIDDDKFDADILKSLGELDIFVATKKKVSRFYLDKYKKVQANVRPACPFGLPVPGACKIIGEFVDFMRLDDETYNNKLFNDIIKRKNDSHVACLFAGFIGNAAINCRYGEPVSNKVEFLGGSPIYPGGFSGNFNSFWLGHGLTFEQNGGNAFGWYSYFGL